MKLALGTAQFGLDYGISNLRGKVAINKVKDILDLSNSHGIEIIDTAIAYGSSQQVLGTLGVDNFSIVTKLPEILCEIEDTEKWINDLLNKGSLKLTKY